MSTIKYILFDAANTLIYKPQLYINIQDILKNYGYNISLRTLQFNHKIVSELYTFPDITSEDFYSKFNVSFLESMGIVSSQELLNSIFFSCKNLPWEPYTDTKHLLNSTLPIGVLSNFNNRLASILSKKLPGIEFKNIFISESLGVAKPDLHFFKLALQEISLRPEEVLYVGDSMKLDIIPALKLGMQVKLIDRIGNFKVSQYRIATLATLF
ncbi:HAD family hydrolase [Patiriisocius hiemis]|uniref:HAD family hydrolase n=1 Tax=Patiriisocius hiemis TaxID=3075604 RepID=A0ABU2YDH3_9FLAO|nr:HAD family hydrolase [Constantimarinum sp. W242]MDT0556047.1 HAD family hydrolase [Constantimarinum sp. W242]